MLTVYDIFLFIQLGLLVSQMIIDKSTFIDKKDFLLYAVITNNMLYKYFMEVNSSRIEDRILKNMDIIF